MYGICSRKYAPYISDTLFSVFSCSPLVTPCVVILELISSKEENNEFKDYRFFQVINLIQSDIKHSFTYYLFRSIKVISTLKI